VNRTAVDNDTDDRLNKMLPRGKPCGGRYNQKNAWERVLSMKLYEAAGNYLGDNVLLNAYVRRVRRDDDIVETLVDSPHGMTRIRSRKLVWAAPPTLRNLAPVDLDELETATFGKLRAKEYSTGIVKIRGLPAGLSLNNVAADTPNNLPPLPGLYGLQAATPELYIALFGANTPVPDALIREIIERGIERLASSGTYPVEFDGFDIFSNHAPFQLGVTGADIADGYYKVLNSLQGRHKTFYNGAAFQTNDSSLIWQFSEQLLPQIVS
jgi:hypothetical protein